jgi:ADP-ribose pyrophosphatase YjhB (NUDIX family)
MTKAQSPSTDFCSRCGQQKIVFCIPENDNRVRKVCSHCQFVHYENPKIVVGAVTTFENQFLLCKRAIEPQLGLWTYPAGFLENGESLEDGAKREAYEEAFAEIEITQLIGTYSLTSVNQVHIIYAATMSKREFKSSFESSDVLLFEQDNIPWENLAFPVIKWALSAFITNASGIIDSKSTNKSLEECWRL